MRIIGHFGKGISYLTQVINDSNSSNYLSILAASYNNYGLILLEKDKPEPMEAIKYFSEAVKTLDRFSETTEGAAWEEGIRVFRGRFYNNLGLAFETADKFEDSLTNYKESLRIKRAIGDLIGISHTSANIAVLYYKFHKYKKASYWKRSVIKLTGKYQLSYQRAYMLRRLGEINCERGRTQQGRKLLQEALQILKKLEGVIFDLELSEKALNACKKSASH